MTLRSNKLSHQLSHMNIKIAEHEKALTQAEMDRIDAAEGTKEFTQLLTDTGLWHKMYAVGAYKHVSREKLVKYAGPYIQCQVPVFLDCEGIYSSTGLIAALTELLGPSSFHDTYRYDVMHKIYYDAVAEGAHDTERDNDKT